jgi:hypothetical protein
MGVNMEIKKFSGDYFLIKLTSRKFWVWVVSSVFVFIVLFQKLEFQFFLSALVLWGVISVIYLIGEPAETGIGTMLGNTKISAELKAGAQANLNADPAKVVEAVKNIKKGE